MKTIVTSSILVGGMILSACSAQIEGGGSAFDLAPPSFIDEKPTIQGPEVEGHWQSDCHEAYARTYRRWSLSFRGGKVQRVERKYTDAKCLRPSEEVSYSGRFRFIDSYKDGGYNIEYAFDLGNGFTSYPQEKIVVRESNLYLSNYRIGEDASIMASEPLYRVEE
jgi:hypothetical protein